jgi:hypothetical protein
VTSGRPAAVGEKLQAFSFAKEGAMNPKSEKIDIRPFEDITVQFINNAARMELIEELHSTDRGEKIDFIVRETVEEIVRNTLVEVRSIFKTLDEHTNAKKFMDRLDLEKAFPEEVNGGRQNQREEAR